jgi:hypothetical protein
MKITISKILLPQLVPIIQDIKVFIEYNIDQYFQTDLQIDIPAKDISKDQAINISRAGGIIDGFPYYIEVPNGNLSDDLPEGLSYRSFLDETGTEVIRTWADLQESTANGTHSLRYWQQASNNIFIFPDIEIIEEAGFSVYDQGSRERLVNKDYSDVGDPQYTVLETIPYIDQSWATSGYFDMVHAHINMGEIYDAKGVDDNARWAASTDEEKEILIRWNHVGLNKASQLGDPGWGEGRLLKEIGKKYREFNSNMTISTVKRFNDWYQYLNMVLSSAGRTKFNTDWDWTLTHEYTYKYLRFYELNATNGLIDWHDTVLSTYIDSDFVSQTLTAAQIISNLRKVLTNKNYFI